MAEVNVRITELVEGDTWKFVRTYTGLATGITITKVYLTIKLNATDADPGAVQKQITTSLTASGQITDDTTTADGEISFNVIVLAAESALLTPGVDYYYDFQGIASDTAIYTFEVGKIRPRRGLTAATS